MRRFPLNWPGLALGGALFAATLPAIVTNLPPSPPLPNAAPTHHLSPVEYFRGLLSMTPAERERELAHRSPADKAAIMAKIHEYEALPRAIREARLCQTELHWALSSLMRLAPADRKSRLREVSALYRPLVKNLLQQWDEVPPATQKLLLEKQNFIGLYLRMQGSSEAAQKEIIDSLSPERQAVWKAEMERWQALPEKERAELCANFQRFCALSGEQQQQTVGALSESERQAMEKALQTFDHMPPAQRAQCINSFGKFATMTPEEQSQFLENAAHWQAMSAHERQLWRELVHTLPPLPPGLAPNMPPMPPLPRVRMAPPPPLPNVTAPAVIAVSAGKPD